MACVVFVMPIVAELKVTNLSKEEFAKIDRIVMGCAYQSQNELGRFCDESVYENDLAERLRSSGLHDVHTQVSVKAVYDAFEKEYLIDLIANNVVYELKTVNELSAIHEAQILNYMMLLGVNRGKLINFRSEKVQGSLKFSPVSTNDRYQPEFDDTMWEPLSENCKALRQHLVSLVKDWGCYLDYHLYEQALIHHFGGESYATARYPMERNGIKLGSHLFNFHSLNTAFEVSGFSNPASQRTHLQKLLNCSPFEALQWINLHHRTIYFETLKKTK